MRTSLFISCEVAPSVGNDNVVRHQSRSDVRDQSRGKVKVRQSLQCRDESLHFLMTFCEHLSSLFLMMVYRNICLLISSVKHTFTFLANLRHFFLQRGTWCPAPGIKWGREMLNLSDLYLFLFSSRRSYAGQPEGRFPKKSFSIGSRNDAAGRLIFFALFVTFDYSASDWVDNSNTEI